MTDKTKRLTIAAAVLAALGAISPLSAPTASAAAGTGMSNQDWWPERIGSSKRSFGKHLGLHRVVLGTE